MRQLVAGNWKMHGLDADLASLRALGSALVAQPASCDVLICPPATLLSRAAALADGAFALGGQNCHPDPKGPFTGEVSAEMLKDAGATFVILGHSERRRMGETDHQVKAKVAAAWRAGLTAIVCVGETREQQQAGQAPGVCRDHILACLPHGAVAGNIVISYEPIWAIGSGVTPGLDAIAAMHAHLRAVLTGLLGAEGQKVRVLYGGSVKRENARAILALPEVGGALVGGASLKAEDFLPVIRAAKTVP